MLLLNGETIKVLCNAGQATVLQIFEAVIRSENLYENYFMGLCALIGGDFVFLPSCLKVYKVSSKKKFIRVMDYDERVSYSFFTNNHNLFFSIFCVQVAPQLWFNDSKKLPSTDNIIFNLFLRIKFFLPELRGLWYLLIFRLLYRLFEFQFDLFHLS